MNECVGSLQGYRRTRRGAETVQFGCGPTASGANDASIPREFQVPHQPWISPYTGLESTRKHRGRSAWFKTRTADSS